MQAVDVKMKEFVKSDNCQLVVAYIKQGKEFRNLDESRAFLWKVAIILRKEL